MTTNEITLFPWDGTDAVKARLIENHTIPDQDLRAVTDDPQFLRRGFAIHMLLVMLYFIGGIGWMALVFLADLFDPAVAETLRSFNPIAINVLCCALGGLAVSAVVFLVIPQRKAKALRRNFEARYQDQYESLGTVGERQRAVFHALDKAETTEDRQIALTHITTHMN